MPNAKYKAIEQAQQGPKVREALARRADRMAAEARLLAASEGVKADIRVEHGTRPKGRSYSRVIANAAQEWGDSRTKRSRILGRVARSVTR